MGKTLPDALRRISAAKREIFPTPLSLHYISCLLKETTLNRHGADFSGLKALRSALSPEKPLLEISPDQLIMVIQRYHMYIWAICPYIKSKISVIGLTN